MKPSPQYLAVLISLIGLGMSWSEVAFSQGVAGLSSPALGVDAKEEAIRNVLDLQETPSLRNSEAARTVSRSRAATKTKSRVDTTSPARDEIVKWNRTVFGLDSREITVRARARTGREIEQRETVQAQQLARIRSILGLEARDDVAIVHLPQRVNRASDALLHPAVAFASAPRQQIKREVVSQSSASAPEPFKVSVEVPQVLPSAPAPSGDMVVEAIFGQSSAPKTPKRYRDEPLPMLADGSASGSRREVMRLPLLMLVPTTPVDDAEQSPEPLSTDAGAISDDRANAIARAALSELTADYLDPLMPLLRALRVSSTQLGAVPALTERDSSTSGTSGVPVVLEAANDEIADLTTTDIDEQAPFISDSSQATEIPASDNSEAPPMPLLAKIEVPKTPVLLSNGNFLSAMLPVVALTKSSEAADEQIAARESLSNDGLNSPRADDVGEVLLTDESLITALEREINIHRPSAPRSSDAKSQVAGNEAVRPDDSGLAAPKQQVATEIVPDEASVTTASSGTRLVAAASISRLPLVNHEEPIRAGAQPMGTGKREAIPLNEALSARFDIFDPKMTAPPISADTFDLFTVIEALAAWFDIFDPKMVAPRGVVSPIEDRHATRLALDSRSLAPQRLDGALLAARGTEAPAGLLRAQTLPNLHFEATEWVDARLIMLGSVEATYAQPESDASAVPRISAANAGKSREQTTPRVFEESTIEKAMAMRALAASTSVVSQEAPHTPLVSIAIGAPSVPQAYASSEGSVQDEVRSALPREMHGPRSGDGDSTAAIAAPDEIRANPLQGKLVALSDSKLDKMRGGFETDSGLKISFGIERAVYINGSLVTTTSLNVSDLSKLSASQAQAAGLSGASLGLIQNGPSNTFAPGQIAASSVATVIQNTLNDQKIQGITLINATVNSLDLIRRANVQSSILNALTDSLRR